MNRRLRVVAALIRTGSAVLVQQRGPGSTRALLWEFPGGKVEPGESEPEALVRECMEELGVTVTVEGLVARHVHSYPDLEIELRLFRCHVIAGEPRALHASQVRFVRLEELGSLELCDADRALVEKLGGQSP